MITTKEKKALLSPIEIIKRLHSSLDFEEILSAFVNYLQSGFVFDSFSYENKRTNVKFEIGTIKKYQLTFNLTADNKKLGKIVISNSTTYSEKKINQLEELLCLLIQPIKNAITHYNVIHASLHDPLTKLLNRSSLKANFQREIKLCKRYKTPLSIIIIDIDDFKKVNDDNGHLAGDKVLVNISKIIIKNVRETDHAFRIGGEEFLILLNNTSLENAQKMAERIRFDVEKTTLKFKKECIPFTISLGISYYQNKDTQQSLIAKADEAMYDAKTSGKNKVVTL